MPPIVVAVAGEHVAGLLLAHFVGVGLHVIAAVFGGRVPDSAVMLIADSRSTNKGKVYAFPLFVFEHT